MKFCWQGDVEEDEMIPDKESDIKPRFHKSKISRQHSVNTKQGSEEVRTVIFEAFTTVDALFRMWFL